MTASLLNAAPVDYDETGYAPTPRRHVHSGLHPLVSLPLHTSPEADDPQDHAVTSVPGSPTRFRLTLVPSPDYNDVGDSLHTTNRIGDHVGAQTPAYTCGCGEVKNPVDDCCRACQFEQAWERFTSQQPHGRRHADMQSRRVCTVTSLRRR